MNLKTVIKQKSIVDTNEKKDVSNLPGDKETETIDIQQSMEKKRCAEENIESKSAGAIGCLNEIEKIIINQTNIFLEKYKDENTKILLNFCKILLKDIEKIKNQNVYLNLCAFSKKRLLEEILSEIKGD